MRTIWTIIFLLTATFSFGQELLSNIKSGITSSLYNTDTVLQQVYLVELNRQGTINVYSINNNNSKALVVKFETDIPVIASTFLLFDYPIVTYSLKTEIIVFDINSQSMTRIPTSKIGNTLQISNESDYAKGIIYEEISADENIFKLYKHNETIIDLPDTGGYYRKIFGDQILYTELKLQLFSNYIYDINTKEKYLLNATTSFLNEPILLDSTFFYATKFGIFARKGAEIKEITSLPIDELYIIEMYQVGDEIYCVLKSDKEGSQVYVINPTTKTIKEKFDLPVNSFQLKSKSILRLGDGVSFINNSDKSIHIIPNISNPDSIITTNLSSFVHGSIYDDKYYCFITANTIILIDNDGEKIIIEGDQPIIKNHWYAKYYSSENSFWVTLVSGIQTQVWRIDPTTNMSFDLQIQDTNDIGIADNCNYNVFEEEIVVKKNKEVFKLRNKQLEKVNENDLLTPFTFAFTDSSLYYLESNGAINNFKRFRNNKTEPILDLHSLIPISEITVLDNYYYFKRGNDAVYVKKEEQVINVIIADNVSASSLLEYKGELFLYGRNGVKSLNQDKMLIQDKILSLHIFDDELFAIGDYIHKYNNATSQFELYLNEKFEFRAATYASDNDYIVSKYKSFTQLEYYTFDGQSLEKIDIPIDVRQYEVFNKYVYFKTSNPSNSFIFDIETKKVISIPVLNSDQYISSINKQNDKYIIVKIDAKEWHVTLEVFDEDFTIGHTKIFSSHEARFIESIKLIDQIYLVFTNGIFVFDESVNEWVNKINVQVKEYNEIRADESFIYFVGSEPIHGNQFYRYNYRNDIKDSDGNTSRLELYPNPVSKEINFSYLGNESSKANIYNTSGQLIQQTELNTSTFNHKILVVDFPIGMYLLEIFDPSTNSVKVGKFVKI